METKAQIYEEIVKLVDKLLDAKKISGVIWMQYKYTDKLRKFLRPELIKIREELENIK